MAAAKGKAICLRGPVRADGGAAPLRLLRAPNPSPMTERGTNTWLLGEGAVTVIDPGPDDPAHLAAILDALGPGEAVERILVTHSHLDHSGLAAALARATGARVLAFADRAGRMPADGTGGPASALASASPGGEGIDRAFRATARLADMDVIPVAGLPLVALHTPGHLDDHLCFLWGDAVFSGDHVMGWSTSLVSPPEGDMGAYMRALDRLADIAPARAFPGHGPVVDHAPARIAELIAHRRAREAQILGALAAGPSSVAGLTAAVYADLAPVLRPAATRNVIAHLIDLEGRSLVVTDGPPGPRRRVRRL